MESIETYYWIYLGLIVISIFIIGGIILRANVSNSDVNINSLTDEDINSEKKSLEDLTIELRKSKEESELAFMQMKQLQKELEYCYANLKSTEKTMKAENSMSLLNMDTKLINLKIRLFKISTNIRLLKKNEHNQSIYIEKLSQLANKQHKMLLRFKHIYSKQ